ncbi:hypothetical protein LO762_20790 [Actinocorallia sp. API 0066]|uniref:CysS/YqeB C-terminal domain-containing protein n=1 Tax=Actinocorallia sp. API 0066 TaxID=2896846 RepID=UPI001E338C72|nr:hypothetical protein [Actinocorallia sp. API 0066]MCD0451612.1 hypothetical protein [Actinocorallia sp. API 0066]
MSDRPFLLFNSLTDRTEVFRASGPVAGVYSCGPLVFAPPHLGIIRGYVCVDVIRRALRWKGTPVRHVVTLTDIRQTRENAAPGGRSFAEVTEHYAGIFLRDLATMNVLPAHHYPRASDHVDAMVEFAGELEARGYAYPTESGLYFDTGRVAAYGALAVMNAPGQRLGARARPAPGRRRTTDFALWRTVDGARHGRQGWPSPWGWGLPGGHLPCSVMSRALLGERFDLHTGGQRHRRLHHVNEIAQSEALLDDGRPWVGHWSHHGELHMGTRPMARGTASGLPELVARGFHPMAYRLFLLGGHYRNQMNYTEDALRAAQATLRRLVRKLAPWAGAAPLTSHGAARARLGDADPVAARLLDELDAAVCADLNTARALAVLQAAARRSDLSPDGGRVLVAAADALLGLGLGALTERELDGAPRAFVSSGASDEEIALLVAAREEARAAGDWARADGIRTRLLAFGVPVRDSARRA